MGFLSWGRKLNHPLYVRSLRRLMKMVLDCWSLANFVNLLPGSWWRRMKSLSKKELKDAFRIYDKECMGYISTYTLKEILKELDNKLTDEDLNNIIEEVDEDGSGTLDFDEFMAMMTG